jgi:hypothetical protein
LTLKFIGILVSLNLHFLRIENYHLMRCATG